MSGTLLVVATPIGNLEDITARALRVLREASLIAAEDTRRTQHLLSRYAITTPTISLNEHNEARKVPALIERLARGERIALVSDAGTPTISDPGQRLVRAAIEAGIRVEPVPGPSALVAAVAASGFAHDSFTFLGFCPSRSKDRKEWFLRLASLRGLAVFYEAPHRIRRTLEDLRRAVGDCSVSVAREVTKIHEEFIRGSISSVLERLPTPIGEFTVVTELGLTNYSSTDAAHSEAAMLTEFGLMTDNGVLTRRDVLKRLAAKHGVPTNRAYRLVESRKKSG